MRVAEGGLSVDVFFSEGKLLTGTVNGKPLDLVVELPVSQGAAAGVYDGRDVRASWQIGSNYGVDTIEAHLEGDCAGVPIDLVGTFALRAWFFDAATVTGTIGSQSVALTVTARRDTPTPTGSVTVAGTIGSAAVRFATTSDRERSEVTGSVGEHPIEMVSLRRPASGPGFLRQVSARGRCLTELAVLMAGCLLYFQPC